MKAILDVFGNYERWMLRFWMLRFWMLRNLYPTLLDASILTRWPTGTCVERWSTPLTPGSPLPPVPRRGAGAGDESCSLHHHGLREVNPDARPDGGGGPRSGGGEKDDAGGTTPGEGAGSSSCGPPPPGGRRRDPETTHIRDGLEGGGTGGVERGKITLL